MSNPQTDLARTPLYALHKRLGARLVPFAGYEMPLQYRGILAEHVHARAQAAFFDVSHMGQVFIRGDHVAEALETVVVGDIKGLAAGRMRYTLMTNEHGGIIDDLMVISGGDHFILIVNAARKAVDVAHLTAHIGDRCDIRLAEDHALVSLQGPAAATVLARLAPPSRYMLFMSAETLRIGETRCDISRSGYTGEDGFEISLPADHAETIARLVLAEPEVLPAGLGARDTLRLEAGLCLYGSDIDEMTTPIEAGLGWTIGKRRWAEGGFPGADLIRAQVAAGPSRRRVGIRLDGRQPARSGADVTDTDGNRIGRVTSGGFGPAVGVAIAIAYVTPEAAHPGTAVRVIVRESPLPARVVALPFVPHRYAK